MSFNYNQAYLIKRMNDHITMSLRSMAGLTQQDVDFVPVTTQENPTNGRVNLNRYYDEHGDTAMRHRISHKRPLPMASIAAVAGLLITGCGESVDSFASDLCSVADDYVDGSIDHETFHQNVQEIEAEIARSESISQQDVQTVLGSECPETTRAAQQRAINDSMGGF